MAFSKESVLAEGTHKFKYGTSLEEAARIPVMRIPTWMDGALRWAGWTDWDRGSLGLPIGVKTQFLIHV